jgi:hypothetical protein
VVTQVCVPLLSQSPSRGAGGRVEWADLGWEKRPPHPERGLLSLGTVKVREGVAGWPGGFSIAKTHPPMFPFLLSLCSPPLGLALSLACVISHPSDSVAWA